MKAEAAAVIPPPAHRTPPLVVVGCSAGKLDHPALARDLYTGPLFRSAWAAAIAITGGREAHIRILSALHGLLYTGAIVEPYNVKLGDPRSIDGAELIGQARDQGIERRRVIALCSAPYADLLEIAFHTVERPLAHQGIGKQRGTLAELARQGRLGAFR